jgi:hypothetical protein
MTTIHDILSEFREAATSNRDMGDKFERLIATYLITDPLQAERFSDVLLHATTTMTYGTHSKRDARCTSQMARPSTSVGSSASSSRGLCQRRKIRP